jgi:hypothetical protein
VLLLALAGFVLEANYERVAVYIDPVTTVILIGVLVVYVWRAVRMWRARR